MSERKHRPIADRPHDQSYRDDLDHGKFGTYTKYKCRCPECSKAAVKARKDHRLRSNNGERPQTVPVYRASRRLRALQSMGYTASDLARMSGLPRNTVQRMVYEMVKEVHLESFQVVELLYEKYREAFIRTPTKEQRKWQQRGLKHEWPPPFLWRDIDDPDEKPTYSSKGKPNGPQTAQETARSSG